MVSGLGVFWAGAGITLEIVFCERLGVGGLAFTWAVGSNCREASSSLEMGVVLAAVLVRASGAV
jgi:hypothetical protein